MSFLALSLLIASSAAFPSSIYKRTTPVVLPLTSAQYGTVYDVEVQFGNQSFLMLLDTGSSDTWVVETGFQCISGADGTEIAQEECNYANKTYTTSSTFEAIQDQFLGVQYGAGIVDGILGYEDVTIGGITVKHQTVGIVNRSVNPGDGIDSGVIGLAYPALTSAHPGTSAPIDSYIYNRNVYDPVLFTMANQSLIEPWFSIALERTPRGVAVGPGGSFGIGALPPTNRSLDFVTVPVEIYQGIPANATGDKIQNAFWATTAGGVVYGNGSATNLVTSQPLQLVVDSGISYNTFPAEIADAINAAFNPPAVPAVISETLIAAQKVAGAYQVDCNATAPTLGIKFGNQTFFHNGQDLITEVGDGTCLSSIAAAEGDGTTTLNFLGDAFLKNVVAVFDFGKNEMRFASTFDAPKTAGNSSTSGVESSASHSLKITLGCVAASILAVFL